MCLINITGKVRNWNCLLYIKKPYKTIELIMIYYHSYDRQDLKDLSHS